MTRRPRLPMVSVPKVTLDLPLKDAEVIISALATRSLMYHGTREAEDSRRVSFKVSEQLHGQR